MNYGYNNILNDWYLFRSAHCSDWPGDKGVICHVHREEREHHEDEIIGAYVIGEDKGVAMCAKCRKRVPTEIIDFAALTGALLVDSNARIQVAQGLSS